MVGPHRTHDNIIRPMPFACLITKATDINSDYVVLMSFHGNSGCTNAPQF